MLYRLATNQAVDVPRTWELGNASINRLLWTTDALTLVGWADVRQLDSMTLNEPSAETLARPHAQTCGTNKSVLPEGGVTPKCL